MLRDEAMTYTWTARSGVRVDSCVPRAEVPWMWALACTMRYVVRKYGMGKRDSV